MRSFLLTASLILLFLLTSGVILCIEAGFYTASLVSLRGKNQETMPPTKRKADSDPDHKEEEEHVPTSRDFVARYAGPPEDEMTQEQKTIRDNIVKSRPRTGLSGPFGPWLAIPEIAQPAQELGRACRYGTSLSFRESELVILLTGAKTKSHAEFDIHVGEAIKAGISMKVIKAIPRDDDFSLKAVKDSMLPLLDNDRERAIATFTAELVDTYAVSDETYQACKESLDDKDSVLVEITSIAGYYTYVAYTLNAFRIPSK
jgi:4-carboxymuconolactone decarboxylase